MRGRCLCGRTVFEVSGAGELTHHCHCGICRKVHGTGFSTVAGFAESTFRIVSGEDGVRLYQSSRGSHRAFCGSCGSPVPHGSFDGKVFVNLGSLEGDAGVLPMARIFVASKAPWDEIHDDLPRFDAYPPGIPDPVLIPREAPRAQPGRVGGSCLCTAVAYEFAGPIDRWHNCHCSRCRLARGAAHASNVFVAADRFSWLRGQDQIDSFKVPEAERFTQSFCRTCGSKTPRVNTQMGYVAIPAGSLDDDPGGRPQSHIFVGSKAPWFPITDALPQFAEYPG